MDSLTETWHTTETSPALVAALVYMGVLFHWTFRERFKEVVKLDKGIEQTPPDTSAFPLHCCVVSRAVFAMHCFASSTMGIDKALLENETKIYMCTCSLQDVETTPLVGRQRTCLLERNDLPSSTLVMQLHALMKPGRIRYTGMRYFI